MLIFLSLAGPEKNKEIMPNPQKIEFSALSDIGKVRAHNEDAIVVCEDYACAVLADGMGGYKAGEVASAMATQIIAEDLSRHFERRWLPHFRIRIKQLNRWLQEAIDHANAQILRASQADPACFGMGTTVVVACFFEDKLAISHVGDSRAYVFRQNRLIRLTYDHSVLQEQIDAGYISEEQARFSAIKNLITRAVGTQSYVQVEQHIHEVFDEDIVMLCSDGLTDMLSHDEILQILEQNKQDLPVCCQCLIAAANAQGGFDNVSVVLLRVPAVRAQSWLQRLTGR